MAIVSLFTAPSLSRGQTALENFRKRNVLKMTFFVLGVRSVLHFQAACVSLFIRLYSDAFFCCQLAFFSSSEVRLRCMQGNGKEWS